MQTDATAKQYRAIKNRMLGYDSIFTVMFLLIFFCLGPSVSLRDYAARLTPHFFAMNAVYLSAFFVLMYALKFPLEIYEGYFLEKRFNLSNQTWLGWLSDEAKKAGIGFLIFLIVVEGIYGGVRAFGGSWWIAAGALWLLVNVVFARLIPTVIIPLFYKYIPLNDAALEERIKALFSRCGVALRGVFVINMSSKTRKANAFVCGLGKSRRVVLGDTLLKDFSAGEIETVVAHELAHYRHHDMLKLLAWGTVWALAAFYVCDIVLAGALLVFGFTRLDDIAFFPLFALCLFIISVILLPVQNWFSRFLERRADSESLQLTNAADDFISMMTKLGKTNLADFSPSRFIEVFLYDHPPINKRIQLAEEFKRRRI